MLMKANKGFMRVGTDIFVRRKKELCSALLSSQVGCLFIWSDLLVDCIPIADTEIAVTTRNRAVQPIVSKPNSSARKPNGVAVIAGANTCAKVAVPLVRPRLSEGLDSMMNPCAPVQ